MTLCCRNGRLKKDLTQLIHHPPLPTSFLLSSLLLLCGASPEYSEHHRLMELDRYAPLRRDGFLLQSSRVETSSRDREALGHVCKFYLAPQGAAERRSVQEQARAFFYDQLQPLSHFLEGGLRTGINLVWLASAQPPLSLRRLVCLRRLRRLLWHK